MPQRQVPLVQPVPPRHFTPQEPQLSLSVFRLRQVPLHMVSLAGQAHWPLVQPVPAGQMVPQAPQLLMSLFKSRQLPPGHSF